MRLPFKCCDLNRLLLSDVMHCKTCVNTFQVREKLIQLTLERLDMTDLWNERWEHLQLSQYISCYLCCLVSSLVLLALLIFVPSHAKGQEARAELFTQSQGFCW